TCFSCSKFLIKVYNVLVTISDNKTGNSVAAVCENRTLSSQDYLSYGALMIGRRSSSSARYTFNGKETDRSTSWQDYGFRDYQPVYKRFDRVDPLTADYPWYTPYQFAGNIPIWAIDLDGLEALFTTSIAYEKYINYLKVFEKKHPEPSPYAGVSYPRQAATVFE
ncbi:MAG: hypothetical protein JJT94_09365, partial [Bernardetiaceae bacterium]|nr:hypothetical protein [Bernardetiaceae bacterium]